MRDDVTMEYSSIYYLHTAWRAMLKDKELILIQVVYYILYWPIIDCVQIFL